MDRALTDAVWIFAAILVLVVLAAVVLATRRFLVERAGGTVECALRRLAPAGGGRPVAPGGGGGWHLGVLAYQRDEICWFRAFGVLARPDRVFHRRALSVVARRPAEPAEAMALGADRFVIEVAVSEVAVKPAADASGSPPGEHVELAMATEAMTGFLAWLEAAPPGSHLADLG